MSNKHEEVFNCIIADNFSDTSTIDMTKLSNTDILGLLYSLLEEKHLRLLHKDWVEKRRIDDE